MPYSDKTKRLLHATWRNMMARCNNSGHSGWHRYGGRGISVCEEWAEFAPFYNWAIDNGYCFGLTIDRKDNDGNYCPANCRWVPQKVNANNRCTNVLVEFRGERKTVQEWADLVGITNQAMVERLSSDGWTLEDALTYPKYERSVKQPKLRKKVEQYTTDGKFVRRWDSLTDAANGLRLHTSNICAALKDGNRTIGGYRWRYAE